MRKSLILLVALGASGVALAAVPTPHEVYQAAESGHLAQAQQMIEQVLREKPRSAEAHYAAAEIYSREGNLSLARQELATAERLEPGLPFAKPASIAALQGELAQRPASGRPLYSPFQAQNPAYNAHPRSGFPFGAVLILVAAVGVIWFIFRRRAQQVAYANTVPAVPGPGGYGAAPGYGPGYGPVPMGGGGIGSTIAGGLAGGLAAGAGIVAGEELARHFLDSDGRQIPVEPQPQNDYVDPDQNSDMGGQDFGINDGSSWDDGGGSFGGDSGGGGDWT